LKRPAGAAAFKLPRSEPNRPAFLDMGGRHL